MKTFETKIINIVLFIVLIYSILSLIRSFGLIILAYSDDYFFNFDFEKTGFIEKRFIYYRIYYYLPYILGLFFSLVFKFIFKIKWGLFTILMLLSFILFRIMDEDIIRPLFVIFENPRMILFFNFIIFSFMVLLTIFLLKKKGRVSN